MLTTPPIRVKLLVYLDNGVKIDTGAHVVYKPRGVEQSLSPQAAAFLRRLAEAAGDVVPSAALGQEMDEPRRGAMEARRVVDDNRDEPRYIINVPSVGYRLAHCRIESVPIEGASWTLDLTWTDSNSHAPAK